MKKTKEELIAILKGLLKTQENVSFLLKLEKTDLEKLVSVVRNYIDGYKIEPINHMPTNPIKIISGGQTGVDRAGLDAAIALGIDYGGSVPKGRPAEDGIVPLKYDRLTELTSASYPVRTEKNVVDADVTIICTEGKPTGGTALTVKMAAKHRKPCCIVNYKGSAEAELVEQVIGWLIERKPMIINIAGPRESKYPGIYQKTLVFLKLVLTAYVKSDHRATYH